MVHVVGHTSTVTHVVYSSSGMHDLLEAANECASQNVAPDVMAFAKRLAANIVASGSVLEDSKQEM